MTVIPILMYHKVGAPVCTKADTFLNVSRRDFERQMTWLQRRGYTGITFECAIEGLTGKRSIPGNAVCVTFDDGYTNVLEQAAPVLDELGWPGTVFIPTAYVGRENAWDRQYGHPLLSIMDWPQLLSLQQRGWEIAGHTRTHPRLESLDDAAAAAEIEQGRNDLAEQIGTAPRTFCYPFGGFNHKTPKIVANAGFAGACTTQSGLATGSTDPYLLPRVKVAYRDGLLGFFYRLKVRPLLQK